MGYPLVMVVDHIHSPVHYDLIPRKRCGVFAQIAYSIPFCSQSGMI